jgi:hypothetical protein
LRIIYEDYRGFKICQQGNTYHAIHTEAEFSHLLLSELLNTVDNYVDKTLATKE